MLGVFACLCVFARNITFELSISRKRRKDTQRRQDLPNPDTLS